MIPLTILSGNLSTSLAPLPEIMQQSKFGCPSTSEKFAECVVQSAAEAEAASFLFHARQMPPSPGAHQGLRHSRYTLDKCPMPTSFRA